MHGRSSQPFLGPLISRDKQVPIELGYLLDQRSDYLTARDSACSIFRIHQNGDEILGINVSRFGIEPGTRRLGKPMEATPTTVPTSGASVT